MQGARVEKTKHRGWRITGWVVLAIVVYIILDSGLIPWGYVRSAPISGTIVDEETGQPIPNVAISVVWPQLIGTMGGTIHVDSGTIKRIEVLSDEQGNYLVPGWKRSKWEIGEGGFGKDRPEMRIYAAGYWPRTLRNKKAGRLGWGEAWKAEWDGEDIELEPMHWREWTKKDWERNLRSEWDIDIYGKIHAWGSSVHLIPIGCEWKKNPEDIVEQIQYNLKKASMFPDIYSVVPHNKYPDDWKICPDTKDVLLEHGLTEEEWEICLAGTKRKHIPSGKGKTIYRNTSQQTIPLPPLAPRRILKLTGEPVVLPGRDRPDHNREGEQ